MAEDDQKVYTSSYQITIPKGVIMTDYVCAVAQLCCILSSPDWNPAGSSVQGILQVKILVWDIISYSRASS